MGEQFQTLYGSCRHVHGLELLDPLKYWHYGTITYQNYLPNKYRMSEKWNLFSKTTVRSSTLGCYLTIHCHNLKSYKNTYTAGSHSGTGKLILTRTRIWNFHDCTPKLINV
jgi:hypothetical protein